MNELLDTSTVEHDLDIAQNRLDYLNMIAPATAARSLHIERWVVQQQVFTLERELEEQRTSSGTRSAVDSLKELESRLANASASSLTVKAETSHHGSSSVATSVSSGEASSVST